MKIIFLRILEYSSKVEQLVPGHAPILIYMRGYSASVTQEINRKASIEHLFSDSFIK